MPPRYDSIARFRKWKDRFRTGPFFTLMRSDYAKMIFHEEISTFRFIRHLHIREICPKVHIPPIQVKFAKNTRKLLPSVVESLPAHYLMYYGAAAACWLYGAYKSFEYIQKPDKRDKQLILDHRRIVELREAENVHSPE